MTFCLVVHAIFNIYKKYFLFNLFNVSFFTLEIMKYSTFEITKNKHTTEYHYHTITHGDTPHIIRH